MTPFEKFYENEFPKMLDNVTGEPGLLHSGISLSDCSWDRKAAYLLWVARGRPQTSNKTNYEDLL